MITTNSVNECINWLKNECDVSFLADSKLKQIVSLVLNWDIKNAEEHAKYTYEKEEKKKQEEATREDYTEEQDENGRTWYCRAHLSTQRSESRKLMQGDAIIFESSLPGGEGTEEGFMIIKSFDFDSDFVARSYYAIENCSKVEKETGYKTNWVSYYGGGAPSIHSFSYATDDEIAQFFSKLKEAKYSDYLFYFKSSITPDYIKQKYHRYLDGYETWETYKKR